MESLLSSELGKSLNIKEYPDDDYSHILGFGDPTHKLSRLQEICRIRLQDVYQDKKPIDTAGCGLDRTFYISEDELYEEIRESERGKPLNLYDKIKSAYPKMAIAAEFKKASPSKGPINLDADPVEQCLTYAQAGASVISILTEFKHFKGTLNDLKRVRTAVDKEFGSLRPAILRKDFIVDRYQILEARAAGADTLLLMVSILGVNQLKDLLTFSRSLDMEPLVEVSNDKEMEIALNIGAKIIGVNNRNLHTFQLDLETTYRSIAICDKRGRSYRLTQSSSGPDILIAALSGISTSSEVKNYYSSGISCCLIGETLMKSSNPKETIQSFIDVDSTEDSPSSTVSRSTKLIKTCGYKRDDEALFAIQHGSNFIGIIFAESSPRKASIDEALKIVETVRKYGERSQSKSSKLLSLMQRLQSQNIHEKSFEWFDELGKALHEITLRKPLTVGVFQDQSTETINDIISKTGIDIVQLHGNESPDIVPSLNAPVIKVLHLPASSSAEATQELVDINALIDMIRLWSGKAIAILLDSKLPNGNRGGTGSEFDWSIINKYLYHSHIAPVILAGGLNSGNVQEAVLIDGVLGVDVSSGIEVKGSPGQKDSNAVQSFLKNAKI